MNGYLFQHLRRYHRWVGFAAVIVLIGGWYGLSQRAQHRRQPEHAKQTYKTVYDRASTICAALGDTCEMDPQPVFSVHKAACYVGDNTPLRLWKFNCTVDGRPLWLIFNDNTGGICYLIAEPINQPASSHNGHAVLQTSSEAAEAGFQRMKAMGLMGHGMSAALRQAPRLNTMSNVWEMMWWVKAAAGTAPYTIRIELDRVKGMPLAILDTANLNDPSRL